MRYWVRFGRRNVCVEQDHIRRRPRYTDVRARPQCDVASRRQRSAIASHVSNPGPTRPAPAGVSAASTLSVPTGHPVIVIPATRRQAVLAFDDGHEIRINYFLPAQNNHIFNEADFFKLHASSADDVYAQLVRVADDKVCATIAFYETGAKVFTSPKRGTFGGLGLNCPLDVHTVEHFLSMLIDYLKAIGACEIDVKCAPFSHDLPLSSLVSNILLRQGSAIASHELNHDMQVDTRPFLQRIDYGNAKRIRKCLREGFVAEQIDPSACEDVYRVIRDNRERRGYPMSMTAEQIKAMVNTFPGKLHFFAVYPDPQKSRIVAAGICIAVSRYILYVFYWGDAADMGAYSPIALLASHIYEFCQREGFRLLDAGTSTLAGELNHGLIKFKRNLGFSESLKLSFVCQV
jgi:hypothetical protein